MRTFFTSRERKLLMQLHKALCKLLWVPHKALVTHSREQVQRGTGRQTGARAPLRSSGTEEGKVSVYTARTVGQLS